MMRGRVCRCNIPLCQRLVSHAPDMLDVVCGGERGAEQPARHMPDRGCARAPRHRRHRRSAGSATRHRCHHHHHHHRPAMMLNLMLLQNAQSYNFIGSNVHAPAPTLPQIRAVHAQCARTRAVTRRVHTIAFVFVRFGYFISFFFFSFVHRVFAGFAEFYFAVNLALYTHTHIFWPTKAELVAPVAVATAMYGAAPMATDHRWIN